MADIVLYTDYMPLPGNLPIAGIQPLIREIFTYVPTQQRWNQLSDAISTVARESTERRGTDGKGEGMFLKQDLAAHQLRGVANLATFDDSFYAHDIPVAIYCGAVIPTHNNSHYVIQIGTSSGPKLIDSLKFPSDQVAAQLGCAHILNNRCANPNCAVRQIVFTSEHDKFVYLAVACLTAPAQKDDELTVSYGPEYVKTLAEWRLKSVRPELLQPCLCEDCEADRKEWEEQWGKNKKGLEDFIKNNRKYMRR